MKQYSQHDKEQIFKKFNIKVKSCQKCGQQPALYRRFAKETLCNECADVEFMKYLRVLAVSAVAIFTLFLIF